MKAIAAAVPRGRVVACGLTVLAAVLAGQAFAPAHAEFELKGARVEAGEVEIEYRGSAHGGLPRAKEGEAAVRKSHDVEYEVGVTDMFAVSAVLTFEELGGGAFERAAVTVETQIELIDRPDFALSILTEYQAMRDSGEADEYEIGPVANWWFGKFDILTNSFFTRQMGQAAESNAWGLQFDIRARYWQTGRFGFGVEFYGEIEELDNAGPFNLQEHYAGPVLYWKFGDEDETGAKQPSPAPKSCGFAVGVMAGLTDVTSGAALKVQANFEF